MNDELQKALKKYYDMFGDGFPTIPLFWGGTEEEHLKMVNECIKQKKLLHRWVITKNPLMVYCTNTKSL